MKRLNFILIVFFVFTMVFSKEINPPSYLNMTSKTPQLIKNPYPPFTVKKNEGNQLYYKPSLRNRINSAKEIQLYCPRNQSNLDRYIYGTIQSYLQGLGIQVELIPSDFERKQQWVSSVCANYTIFNEAVEKYISESGQLGLVANYVASQGQYMSGISLGITVIDVYGNYDWEVDRIDVPSRGEKFKKRLMSAITDSYHYVPSYATTPSYYFSNWNENTFMSYFKLGKFDMFEGIYKNQYYSLGVKKGEDGKYYMVYLSDDLGFKKTDWKEGDIKAKLSPTASQAIFTANWYGRWKQQMDYTIIFSPIGLTIKDNKGESEPETYLKICPTAQDVQKNETSSGSGFFISKDGLIITNHHVIKNAKNIKITGVNGDYNQSYNARVEISDQQNDLAILKITDDSFTSVNIPYSFKFNTSSIGEDCFVLGYPLISSMGRDIKLTTGIISSKTGFEGNISQYQISAAVQPGNSGGPLFDKNGYIIGVVQAKHTQAENAGYAIKSSYIRNLVELLPDNITLPTHNTLFGKPLPKQVELASNAVCLIIVNDR